MPVQFGPGFPRTMHGALHIKTTWSTTHLEAGSVLCMRRRLISWIISCYDIYVIKKKARLTTREFQELAEFRYQIRRFLRFSEDQARACGIEAQQHQLLLAIKGLPRGAKPTIGELASRMMIRHHSAVELVNRLTLQGAVQRVTAVDDHREVHVRLTMTGETLLHRLSVAHHDELRAGGPELMKALSKVLGGE
jgi:DNA-binding MarR family transcriptional regulator